MIKDQYDKLLQRGLFKFNAAYEEPIANKNIEEARNVPVDCGLETDPFLRLHHVLQGERDYEDGRPRYEKLSAPKLLEHQKKPRDKIVFDRKVQEVDKNNYALKKVLSLEKILHDKRVSEKNDTETYEEKLKRIQYVAVKPGFKAGKWQLPYWNIKGEHEDAAEQQVIRAEIQRRRSIREAKLNRLAEASGELLDSGDEDELYDSDGNLIDETEKVLGTNDKVTISEKVNSKNIPQKKVTSKSAHDAAGGVQQERLIHKSV